jgi:phosphatidylserine/phosphatidylglycerophosphate/cardiolipin synthase-like enzyme
MTGALEETFLADGAQTAQSVADLVAGFVSEAARTLDVAIYDFEARDGASARIADALEAARGRGVAVRLAFNAERCENPADDRPMKGTPETIDGLDVPTRGIHEEGALMHHKYVVRDGASVLTGSTNWTDDAFTREENAVLTVDSTDLAAAYTANFEELWRRGKVERSGAAGAETTLLHGVRATPYFSPHPPFLSQLAASRIVTAERRLKILSPVVTSGAVLGTLTELIGRERLQVAGAYDATQMEQVKEQWADVPSNRWKIAAWEIIAPHLSGKVSTPFAPGSVHDYMHAKALVVDDEVITGSYNLSRHGEVNAENVLHIVDEETAVRFAAFADRVAARYRAGVSPSERDASGDGATAPPGS